MGDKELVDVVLEAAFIAAPSQTVKEQFTKMFHDMSMDGLSDEQISMVLLSNILDGLNKGNWPDPRIIVCIGIFEGEV